MSGTGRPIYTTPTEVRAIPEDQWERWVRAGELPLTEFAPDVLSVVAAILKATRRRMDADGG